MFEQYKKQLSKNGTCEREAISSDSITIKELNFTNTQSYKKVKINGKYYDARIIQDVSDTVKAGNGNYLIEFRNNENFYSGTYLEIENKYNELETWLIIDTLDDLFFSQYIIKKCNYELKWLNRSGEFTSRWIAIDDSYKIYDGVKNYGYKTNLPESNIVAMISFDKETKQISTDQRFLIDDIDCDIPEAYVVTNRNAISRVGLGRNYGVMSLVLSRDQFNPTLDNKELMIANYYKHQSIQASVSQSNIGQVSITYTGESQIVMNTPYKKFTCKVFDPRGNELSNRQITWRLHCLPEFEEYFEHEFTNNQFKVRAKYNENLQDYNFKISATDLESSTSASIIVKVVTGI